MNTGFQILDKNNTPISINQLDREICELLGKEVDPKWYCTLGKREDHESDWEYISKTTNWFDSLGYMIASENKSFEDIINYYKDVMKDFLGKVDSDGILITIEYIYPYHMKVLNYWIEQGYTPKQVQL